MLHDKIWLYSTIHMKTYKPYTPSRRFMVGYSFDDLTTDKPHKALTRWKKSTAGKNNQGRTTTRFRWGWHKRRVREIDSRRYDKENIPAKVEQIEYDPNRTSWIMLVCYADGERRYHLAPKGIAKNDAIICGNSAEIKTWNRKQLFSIPEWVTIYNLEVTPLTKWKLIKSAWAFATIVGKDELAWLVFIKLPSWEVRKFHKNCRATIGIMSNEQHKNIVLWKAWRSRWLWRRPKNRGKSMNPVDHPHGWGEGATSIGMRYPKSFTGKPVPPGKKTRRTHKRSDKFIVSKRKK